MLIIMMKTLGKKIIFMRSKFFGFLKIKKKSQIPMLYNTFSMIEENVPKFFKIGYFLPKLATWAKNS